MKQKQVRVIDSNKLQWNYKHTLMNKYYNMFLSNYRIEGLEHEDEDYLLKKLWSTGTIAAFDLKNVGVTFAPYAPASFGRYGVPASINIVNEWNVPNYPKGILTNNINCCIGFASRNHKPIREQVEQYVDQMVEILMAMYIHLQTSKLPFTITGDEDAVQALLVQAQKIVQNDLAIYIPTDNVAGVGVFNTGILYDATQYWTQYKNFDNEILMFLGIDCNELSESARVAVDAVNANNQAINVNKENIKGELEFFIKKINELFGTSLSLKTVVGEQEIAAQKAQSQLLDKQEDKDND